MNHHNQRQTAIKHGFEAFMVGSLIVLASCASLQQTDEQRNTAGSPQVNQAIGHHAEAAIIPEAAATMTGYLINTAMDSYDRQELNHVFERGVTGSSTSWINPDTGNRFSVTPEAAYSNPQDDQYCRKADIRAIIIGKEETVNTFACRDTMGQWQLR